MFDPTIGRFTSEDPAGFGPGDPNLYRYVKNSPTNFTDPSGLVPSDLLAQATQIKQWSSDGRKLAVIEKALFRITVEAVYILTPEESWKILTNSSIASRVAAEKITATAIDQLFKGRLKNDPVTQKLLKEGVEKLYSMTLAQHEACTLPQIAAGEKRASLIATKRPLITSTMTDEAFKNYKLLGGSIPVSSYTDLELVMHELTHSAQQYLSIKKHQDGGLMFLLDYFKQYGEHKAAKKSDDDAYHSISYEIVAYSVQEAIHKMFLDPKNQKVLETSVFANETPVVGQPVGGKNPVTIYENLPNLNSEKMETLRKEFLKEYTSILAAKCKQYGVDLKTVQSIP